MLQQTAQRQHSLGIDYIFDSWEDECRLSYVVWRLLNPGASVSLDELLVCSEIFESALFAPSDEGLPCPIGQTISALSPISQQSPFTRRLQHLNIGRWLNGCCRENGIRGYMTPTRWMSFRRVSVL